VINNNIFLSENNKLTIMVGIFKVVIGGSGGVGKSSLIQRYVNGSFMDNQKMTIGAQFHVKALDVDNQPLKLQLWDFAGEERFRFMLADYCLGAQGAFIVYDVTDFSTFEQVVEWLKIIRTKAKEIPIMLVGNKYDLPNHEVTEDAANQLSQEAKCIGNVMVSAKIDLNVNEMFDAIARWIIFDQQQKLAKKSIPAV
jgi:small GTP-binding protein